uniref:Uncharacterized protein n=1 Tax=Corvus moneduloides TaxID=1196302 RepID=A0A8C3D9Q4_CORMO
MSRNKHWRMGCLAPSTGGGNVPLTLVLVRHLHSWFFLADKLPPPPEGCGFLNMVHFSPSKEYFWATDKISVEQKYPFPSSPLFPKGFWEFQLHAFWQSQRQQGSHSLVWVFAG